MNVPLATLDSPRRSEAPMARAPVGRAGRIRVLLACAGWPSGILEIGSWARRTGWAEVSIFQLQPGLLFQLDPDDRHFLRPGLVDPKLIDAFGRRRRTLSDDAMIEPMAGGGRWLRDPRRRQQYHILPTGERWTVYQPDHFQRDEHLQAVARAAQRLGSADRVLQPDGTLQPRAWSLLAAVGGRYVEQLESFAPHVVGFRVEGEGSENVEQFVAATRLFSRCEIVLGGPTATSHPVELLDDFGADYVFAGEAEEAFVEFLRAAWEPNSKDRAADIPGLAFCYGGRAYHNTLPADGYGRNLLEAGTDDCRLSKQCLRHAARPVADAALLAANRLDWSILHHFGREFDSLYFTGGRGCPGACTFCAKLHGQQLRVKRAAQLLEEIEQAAAAVDEGRLCVTRWPLFEHTDCPEMAGREVAWAAVYDEDFFLDRRRAVEFFELWSRSPLRHRFRLGFQTNPSTLVDRQGRIHADLFHWIDRLKPMIQIGAESFNPELLARWHKRHTLAQLRAALDAMDRTHQDYAVFVLLTDFLSTPEEVVQTLRLLVLEALPRRRMRIASSPFTIPLYDSDARRWMEFGGRIPPGGIRHFSDYERPRPDWLDPLAAELADLADSELRWTLNLSQRDAALVAAVEAVADRAEEENRRAQSDRHVSRSRKIRIGQLHDQAARSRREVADARFQAVAPW